jgi:hypothetical protein
MVGAQLLGRQRTLETILKMINEPPQNTPRSLWASAFRDIERPARQILRMSAMLSEDEIPLKLFLHVPGSQIDPAGA